MPISGLVITLSSDAQLADRAVSALGERNEFNLGERNARWLPVAMDARTDAESRDLHDWISAQPGIEYVDVVYVNFDEDRTASRVISNLRGEP